MKIRFYKTLYGVFTFLSNRFNNRYLTKYKVLLGTSLLILMNVSPGCRQSVKVTCYVLPALPKDTIEVQTVRDSTEVVNNEVPADLENSTDMDSLVNNTSNRHATSDIEEDDTAIPEEIVCYIIVETMPKFPGGDAGLMSYINKNIRYPAEAKNKGIDGQVTVEFVIMKDGSVDSVKIRQTSDSIFNEEVLRVIQGMPKWSLGTNKRKPVEMKYTLPVNFRLPR